MRHPSAAFLPFLLLALALRPAFAEPSSGTALDGALAELQSERICADVRFLADDELEGRDTPSRGLRVAARYLRARIASLGWQPGAGEDYLQPWSLEHLAVDPTRSRIDLEAADGRTRSLAFGEGYLFSPWEVGDRTVEGGVVYCGTGTGGELDGLELSGRWSLCVDSKLHPNSRRNLVRRAGALGLLVVPDPETGVLVHGAQLVGQAADALRGRVQIEARADQPPGSVGRFPTFHQAYLTASGARALFDLAGGSELPALGETLEVHVREERRLPGEAGAVVVENVCGFLPGSDPVLRNEVILVSAHYDHEGVIDGEIYNGADDNASGSSCLLALADALADYPLRRSVMLVWVSGEEKGLFGSRAWVESPTLPAGMRAVCDINLDMVGRNAPEELYVTPSRRHPKHNGLVELATRLAPLEGFPVLGSADRYYERSDHAVFAELAIPVVFLFNGEHADYHRPSDTADKIDCDKIRRVSRLVLRMIDALQGDVLDL